jgi:hypothetical protein
VRVQELFATLTGVLRQCKLFYNVHCRNLGYHVRELKCSLPESIGSLSELEYFSLNDLRGMTGGIPESIGNLAKLTYLRIRQYYRFSDSVGGTIPASIGNLSSLETLDFDFIGLTGEIPEELGRLSNLTFFKMNGMKISGSIPSSFIQLSKLVTFDVWNMQHWQMNHGTLTGIVPPLPSSLTTCKLYGNSFECLWGFNHTCKDSGYQGASTGRFPGALLY